MKSWWLVVGIVSSIWCWAGGDAQATSDSLIQACYLQLRREVEKECDGFHNAVRRSIVRRSATESETVVVDVVRRRLPRNIVLECCRRPCDGPTLRKYCSRIRRSQRLSETGVQGQGSTTESVRMGGQGSSTQSTSQIEHVETATASPTPEPIPIGDFGYNHLYGP